MKNNYQYPNDPFSSGNTTRMSDYQKQEKEKFKREEIKTELKLENRRVTK